MKEDKNSYWKYKKNKGHYPTWGHNYLRNPLNIQSQPRCNYFKAPPR